MPIERKLLPKVTTPRGTAVYPRINKPDTKYKEGGEYSVKLRLSDEDAAPLIAKIDAFHAEAYEIELADQTVKQKLKKRLTKLKLADKPYKVATKKVDGEYVEIAGFVDFNCKRKASGTKRDGSPWKAHVALFDAAGKSINKEVWGGSIVKCRVVLVPWFADSLGFGVRLELQAVQVLELVGPGGERSATDYGFDEEEGYRASTTDADAPADAPEGAADGSEGLNEF